MKSYLDLLPTSFRDQLRVQVRRRVWPAVWLLTFLGCAAVVLWQRHDMGDLEWNTARLRTQVAPLREMQLETRRLRADLAKIGQRHSLVESLRHRRPPIRLVGAVSRSAATLTGSLLVNEIRLVRREEQPQTADKSKAVVVVRHAVTVLGTAHNEVAVAEFVQSLRESAMFHSVQLRSTAPLPAPDERHRLYEVTCVY